MEEPNISAAQFSKQIELRVEVLANLIYLTEMEAEKPEKVLEYMQMAKAELAKLSAASIPFLPR